MARFQVTFDCADVDRQAEFWAAVLHYQLQPPPEGYDTWERFLTEHNIPYEPGRASAIVDPEGVGPRIFFQRVPEPKTAKNRMHLDINLAVPRDLSVEDRKSRLTLEAHRLVGLGAQQHRVYDQDGELWIVMSDPEGNEFCIQ